MESKIRALIKQSMLEKNKNKTITYRSILETAQKTAKKTNVSVTDDIDDLKSFDINKCNERFENFYRLHNLEVNRLTGKKNLSSIAI